MRAYLKHFAYPLILFVLAVIFFWQVFFKGLLPLPSDTIVGLYHPFRDLYAKDYPRGIPFKNFLITDPVRQQYVWKKAAIDQEKRFKLPAWNPYSLSGSPLLANFQTGAFYPLNIVFFVLSFPIAWSMFIFLQIFLGGLFMFLYLRNQNLDDRASLFGSIAFCLSGFFIAWLEWGNILNTAIWLPLILLSLDKLFANTDMKWVLVLIFSTVSSFFAGHLQTFFYVGLLSFAYVVFLLHENKKNINKLPTVLVSFALTLILILLQLIPTMKFILTSARDTDLNWHIEGWFIPAKHLVQFLVPDFFGNPTTLNYFGVWNYAEFVGFVGIVPLLFAVYSIWFKDRKGIFFSTVTIISLILALQNPLSRLPFELSVPLISSAQPTRLLFLIDFSLAVMAAFGLNYFIKNKNKKRILISISFLATLFLAIGIFLNISNSLKNEDLLVARRNFYFPITIFGIGSLAILLGFFLKNKKISGLLITLLIVLTTIDLLRFGWKFTPFTKSEYLFPQTKTISFLQNQEEKNFRIMSLDSRILPPNFPVAYKLQSIEGYDPLYSLRYGELIVALQRNEPNINQPFDFNRIITPHDIDDKFISLLNVKYLLALSEISNPNYSLVFEEGETKVYENANPLPRTFFVNSVINTKDKSESIKKMFDNLDFNKNAVVEGSNLVSDFVVGKASIASYSENEVIIQTDNNGSGFLVLLDSFYPSWKAKIDEKNTKIFITDYNFRGIQVPAGKHKVVFYTSIL